MFLAKEAPDLFVLDEIDKIVRERWRIIEKTTRYGWLIASARNSNISREDSTILSALAVKIGYERCEEAFQQIRKFSQNLHPVYVPKIALAVLDEMYTFEILRKRERSSKWRHVSLRGSQPTVFTICQCYNSCFSKNEDSISLNL